MLYHYFKTVWRDLKRNKFFSFINIFGLALGMSVCLLILQYVSFELGYENFQTNGDRVFRVEQDRYNDGKLSTRWAAGAFAVGNHFKDAIPEIEDYVKVVEIDNSVAYVNNQPLKIDQVFYATNSFFEIFTFPLIAGNSKLALNNPNTAAISESTAKKVFGTLNVVGKSLKLNRTNDYIVTAVFKDAPDNTQLKPNILISYATFLAGNNQDGPSPEDNWEWDGCLTYLLLNKNANPKEVELKFTNVVQKFKGADLKSRNVGLVYHLQPLKDIHLHSNYLFEPGEVTDGKIVYLLLGIALFILIVAWSNYVNLATARAITRAKEIGIRKSIGSRKGQLILQFLLESALVNFIALLFALVIISLAIPGFNLLSGLHLSFSLFKETAFWMGFGLLLIVGTCASGLYPAIIISGFNPVEVLNGRLGATKQNNILRKSLVTFQFIASLFLLIGTTIVFQQIQFMRKQSLGVNIDKTLVLKPPTVGVDSSYLAKIDAFKKALMGNTSIKDLTVSSNVPGDHVELNAGGIKLVNAADNAANQYRFITSDFNYLKFYGIKLIAGRPFSRTFGTDLKNNAVIFTEKAVKQLGFDHPKDAINKEIVFWNDTCTVVGVAANYHQQSLKQDYDQIIIKLDPNETGFVSLKLNAQDANHTIDYVKNKWNKFFPGNTFEYFFLDDHFNAQYKSDQQFGRIFTLFTCLAVFVACMGLFGLASFTTLQRNKEIGIRKVLGASMSSILKLLFKETAILLLVAFIITTPLALFATSEWLTSYAFKIRISWLFFIVPFLSISLIAILTIGWQVIRAARANPVDSLKME